MPTYAYLHFVCHLCNDSRLRGEEEEKQVDVLNMVGHWLVAVSRPSQ
jgi:hypothetical protein